MALETAVVRATTPASTGTVDFTSSGFGTPVAAMFFLCNDGADDTVNEDFVNSVVGFTDGTNDRCVGVWSNDNGATSSTGRFMHSYLSVLFTSPIAVGKYGTFNSWVTDGVRIDWNVVGGTAQYDIVCVLIKGVSAAVGTFTPNGTQNGTASETGLGFDPDAVFFATNGSTLSATPSGHSIFGYGCAVNDGSNTQRWLGYWDETAVATMDVGGIVHTSRCIGQAFNGSLNWSGEITAWPTGGFTMTTRDGATGGDAVVYLAITDGGSNLSLQTIASPTSTGTQDYTVSGTPHTAIGAMSTLASTGSVAATDGHAMFAGQSSTSAVCNAVGSDAGASTSQTYNKQSTVLIDSEYVTGGTVTTLAKAAVNAWSSNTLQFDWTIVDASTRYGWVLIASDAGGASSGDITDAFLVSDTHLATATTPAVTSDSGLIADTQAPLATSSATTSDAGLAADTQVALATVAAATSDSILAADTQASTAAAAVTTVDAALIADTQVATAAAAVTIADSGLISDTQDGAIGASTSSATTADAALMSDSFSATATVPAATSDAILVSDNQVATVVVAAVTSDSILIADVMAGSSVGGAFPIASVYTVAATAGRVTVEPASTGSVYIVGATTGLVILKGNR